MSTHIKVTYVALNEDGNKPIMTANTFENLLNGLNEYYGVGKDESAECLGFRPYNTKYPDDYEGYYEYKYIVKQHDNTIDEYIDKIKVYCVDYHPHTVLTLNN